MLGRPAIAGLLALTPGCRADGPTDCDPYVCATPEQRATFKQVRLPFAGPIAFRVHQGAFGSESHNEPGNEYSWDLDVPYGTRVVAIEAGTVLEVSTPGEGGGCDPAFAAVAHNVKVEHADGTVAQYVHVDPTVEEGQAVAAGDPIARTALNGFICTPHLHLGVYRSREHLYNSPQRETLPLRFADLPGELLVPGRRLEVNERG